MKLRRIAAALVIVSLGAASFTFAAVRGQMADCRIAAKTIVGDAAAAAGLSASFGMGLQNQLYWRNVYTYGGADDGADVQETTFSRKNPFPADKKGPVPYVRLDRLYGERRRHLVDIADRVPPRAIPIRQERLVCRCGRTSLPPGAAERAAGRSKGSCRQDGDDDAGSEAPGYLPLLSDRGRSDGDVHLGSVTG